MLSSTLQRGALRAALLHRHAARAAAATAAGPLSGVRVVDLVRCRTRRRACCAARARTLSGSAARTQSSLLPGPLATLMLSELGADVVKVEAPQGDDSRRIGPPTNDGSSYAFHSLNRGKRSVALDLKTPDGRARLDTLLRAADVLVEGFRPGVMARLGAGPDDVRARHPRLIFCSISGFGADGPDAGRPGHDIGYLARAGVLAAGALEPTVMPSQVADVGGGTYPAVVQILAALYARERTGEGCHIDVSMHEGAVSFACVAVGLEAADVSESAPPDMLLAVLGHCPCYRVYATSDGHLAVGALEAKFWARFVTEIGRPHLARDGLSRGEKAREVVAEVQAVLSRESTATWASRLDAADCCVEPVLRGGPSAALRGDRQLLARAAGVTLRGGLLGKDGEPLVVPRVPFSLPGVRHSDTPAPRLGEMNAERGWEK